MLRAARCERRASRAGACIVLGRAEYLIRIIRRVDGRRRGYVDGSEEECVAAEANNSGLFAE